METLIRISSPGNLDVTFHEGLDEAWRLRERKAARARRITEIVHDYLAKVGIA